VIKLSQVKCSIDTKPEQLIPVVAKKLHISENQIKELKLLKESLDARKKDELSMSYQVAISFYDEKLEEKLLHKLPENQVSVYKKQEYSYEITGTKRMNHAPIIVGAGPAGLMCAYHLAQAGFRPIVIERGKPVLERVRDVEHFFATNELNPESNVQFGEGGAGTFSDGKLNTLIKDPKGYGMHVYELFVACGAPESILYQNKPHIGTDVLQTVVYNLREEIIRLGGTFRFETKLTDLVITDDKLHSVFVNDTEEIPCEQLILAIGHSARDTVSMLRERTLSMEPKAFAMGLRVQHPRTFINESQYGRAAESLPTADYKLTHTTKEGKGVYSFCMCPGGYVVNASSELGRVAVNGMSNHDRMAENSNSAIVITVTPEDYEREMGDSDVFSGMHFQRKLEENAYREGKGLVPAQRYEDYQENRASVAFGHINPCNKGAVTLANLRKVLPEFMNEAFLEGMEAFARKIPGFNNPDTVLCGVESRTSSPIRMVRNEQCESNVVGIYPCGEGAGYAGGITSAAIDGIRVFEEIIKVYKGVL